MKHLLRSLSGPLGPKSANGGWSRLQISGWTVGKTIAETPVDDFESIPGQHAWTTFHLFKKFAPLPAKNKWKHVIVVSADTATNPQGKAAQEDLVLNLATELKDANIILVRSIDVDGSGRGTTPEEIVASMLHLRSDAAGKVNGARIPLFR